MHHTPRRSPRKQLPPPPKALPADPPQPIVGPPPPKSYKEQNCLPSSWTPKHEKLHKLLLGKPVEELIKLLQKFLRIRDGGYREAPKEITDTHIDVARYILENNYIKKI